MQKQELAPGGGYCTCDYFVSYYDYLPEVRKEFRNLSPSVQFHDITLRDGEQQANIIFRKEEKIKIARKLDEAGIDRIEAGMPGVRFYGKLPDSDAKSVSKVQVFEIILNLPACLFPETHRSSELPAAPAPLTIFLNLLRTM